MKSRVVGTAVRLAASQLEEAGVPGTVQEARELLGSVLGCKASEVALRAREKLTEGQYDALTMLLRERCRRRPLAQVLGSWSFSGDIRLFTPDCVLVPRPETEELLEWVAEEADPREAGTVVDVGTGSGCLAIGLAKRLPKARIVATDVSEEALAVARKNAELNGVDKRITFFQGDLLNPVILSDGEGSQDSSAAPQNDRRGGNIARVVANPPYVKSGDIDGLDPEVRHEPRLALDGGPDGMTVIDRLVPQAFDSLRSGGRFYLEVGYDQAEKTAERLRKAGFAEVRVRKDISGTARFVRGERP